MALLLVLAAFKDGLVGSVSPEYAGDPDLGCRDSRK